MKLNLFFFVSLETLTRVLLQEVLMHIGKIDDYCKIEKDEKKKKDLEEEETAVLTFGESHLYIWYT